MHPAEHPEWCRCRRCEAADREQERAALAGVADDPVVEAEFGPPAAPARSPFGPHAHLYDLTDKSQRRECEMVRDEPGYSF